MALLGPDLACNAELRLPEPQRTSSAFQNPSDREHAGAGCGETLTGSEPRLLCGGPQLLTEPRCIVQFGALRVQPFSRVQAWTLWCSVGRTSLLLRLWPWPRERQKIIEIVWPSAAEPFWPAATVHRIQLNVLIVRETVVTTWPFRVKKRAQDSSSEEGRGTR